MSTQDPRRITASLFLSKWRREKKPRSAVIRVGRRFESTAAALSPLVTNQNVYRPQHFLLLELIEKDYGGT